MKSFLVLFFFFLVACGFSQQMRIGILTDYQLKKIKFHKAIGNYHVMADSIYLGLANSNDIIEINFLSSGKLVMNFKGNKYSSLKKISILSLFEEQCIQLTGINPTANGRLYEGDFELMASKSAIKIINSIDIETYLEGVVECEAGDSQKLEYYKVQSIISRTYAQINKNKHSADGYQLCDKVHCQVYQHKRLNTSVIDSAVCSTKSKVLRFENGTLAPTFFSANCGGQTCTPSQVWNEYIEGLHSFQDTFCIYTKQATWHKSIPISDWVSFVVSTYRFPIDDSLSLQLLYNFEQEDRQAFYIHPGYGIPLRDLREKFKLKSTYFNAKKEGEFMVLNGRGFGHGVGMCQEGAMKMARLGYSYDQIIGYYFPDYIVK